MRPHYVHGKILFFAIWHPGVVQRIISGAIEQEIHVGAERLAQGNCVLSLKEKGCEDLQRCEKTSYGGTYKWPYKFVTGDITLNCLING